MHLDLSFRRAPLLALGLLATAACSPATTTPPTASAPAATVDDERGGRLYDNWAKETRSTFEADDETTPGMADGSGGANGDGTLFFADGRPLLNDAGHDYRLKNLFGWDLRGSAGIYGPQHLNKSYVLDVDLLATTESVTELTDLLEQGSDEIPAFGPVLSRAELETIAAFIVGVREGALANPAGIYSLAPADAGAYALVEGADPANGAALFAQRCAGCHGDDGTRKLFDDGEYSLGSHARQKAYEDWAKILNGHPASPMHRQVTGSGAEMTQQTLDLLAALCDRQAFPLGSATKADVADGDPRCGAYLR